MYQPQVQSTYVAAPSSGVVQMQPQYVYAPQPPAQYGYMPQYVMQPGGQPVIYATAAPSSQPAGYAYPAYGIPVNGASYSQPPAGYPGSAKVAPSLPQQVRYEEQNSHHKLKTKESSGKDKTKEGQDEENKDSSDGSSCCLFTCLAGIFVGIIAIFRCSDDKE